MDGHYFVFFCNRIVIRTSLVVSIRKKIIYRQIKNVLNDTNGMCMKKRVHSCSIVCKGLVKKRLNGKTLLSCCARHMVVRTHYDGGRRTNGGVGDRRLWRRCAEVRRRTWKITTIKDGRRWNGRDETLVWVHRVESSFAFSILRGGHIFLHNVRHYETTLL